MLRHDDPSADLERLAGVNRHPAEQIGDKSLRREPDCDAADPAECQKTGNGKAERLQRHQDRGDHDGGAHQFADGIHRCGVKLPPLPARAHADVLFDALHDTQQKPRHQTDDGHIARRRKYLRQQRKLPAMVQQFDDNAEADDPDHTTRGLACRAEERFFPQPPFRFGAPRNRGQHAMQNGIDGQHRENDDECEDGT